MAKEVNKTHSIILALILLVSFWVRFHGLAGYGLFDSDAVAYSTCAKQWSEGNYTNAWAKPGYHLLGSLSVKLLGYHDFSLLYLNSFFDVINILLIFTIGLILGVRILLCLSLAALYGFTPSLLYEGMRGLPHLVSVTFTLLAFISLLFYLKEKKYKSIFVVLTGIFSASAGFIHPTLFILPVFCGAVILFSGFKRPLFSKENLFRKTPLDLFMLAALAVFFGLAALMARKLEGIPLIIWEMAKNSFLHYQCATQGSQGFLNKLQYTYAMRNELFSGPVILFIVTGILLSIALNWKQKVFIKHAGDLSLIWGFTFFFILVSFLVARGWAYRLLIPVMPFVLIGVIYQVNMCVSGKLAKYSDRLILFSCLGLAGFNLAANPGLIKKEPTLYRQLANTLCGKVDKENRLLTMPSQLYSYKIESVYFDGDNIYRVKAPWKPQLKELLSHKIKYIMVAKELYRSLKELNRIYPRTPEDFAQLDSEYRLIYAGLNGLGARKIYESNKLSVYEIPGDMPKGITGPAPTAVWDAPFYNETHLNEVVSMNCKNKG